MWSSVLVSAYSFSLRIAAFYIFSVFRFGFLIQMLFPFFPLVLIGLFLKLLSWYLYRAYVDVGFLSLAGFWFFWIGFQAVEWKIGAFGSLWFLGSWVCIGFVVLITGSFSSIIWRLLEGFIWCIVNWGSRLLILSGWFCIRLGFMEQFEVVTLLIKKKASSDFWSAPVFFWFRQL